ncbi:MAG TPA: 3-deoxy-7-phosphoheptulonate synthase, partial [Firmicutes bacterium]|nr:3-deoxy-7-phosphoheptulonate synthase [Bacillota bacterium]
PEDTLVSVGDVTIGAQPIVIAAGPCSVESNEQLGAIAKAVKATGARVLRGGAFKPRTSPYSFQGLKTEGLVYLKEVAQEHGLPVVSEITDLSYLETFAEHVDIIQVGARSMQNFELLKELGRTDKPVLLKRGFANTLSELLMSAEYVMSGGNGRVILCERGIRTFETATRNTLDVSAVPVLKRMTHLPVFVDPSHAGGAAWLVDPLALAAVAAGADGLLIEVHNDPAGALSDGQQSLTPGRFADLFAKLKAVAAAVGRSV